MLVLTRKVNETVIQDGIVTIRVLGVRGDRVRLGFEAPQSVNFVRGELECGEGADGKASDGRAAT